MSCTDFATWTTLILLILFIVIFILLAYYIYQRVLYYLDQWYKFKDDTQNSINDIKKNINDIKQAVINRQQAIADTKQEIINKINTVEAEIQAKQEEFKNNFPSIASIRENRQLARQARRERIRQRIGG